MQRPRDFRTSFFALILFPWIQGCQGVPNLASLGQGLGTISQAAAPIAGLLGGQINPSLGTPAGLPGMTSSLGAVPGLSSPGVQGSAPQAGFQPAGMAGNATVQDLQSRYQLRLTGNGLDPTAVQTLSEGLAQYRPDQLQGLQEIRVIQHGKPAGQGALVAGVWEPNGGPQAVITLYAWTDQNISVHTVVHESAHHFTLGSNPQFGDNFQARLLQESPQGCYPTEYSQADEGEMQAENLTAMLLGPSRMDEPIRPGYAPSPNAKAMVQQAFGRLAI